MFFDDLCDDDYDDSSSLEISIDEEAEKNLKDFCHRRLRCLSIGSAVFNENDSILSTADCDGSVVHKVCEQGMLSMLLSCTPLLRYFYLTRVAYHYLSPAVDVDRGDIIGSGGFSDILEVRNIKGSSESIETAGTIPTYISHPKPGHRRNSSLSSDCSQQSYALKQLRKDIPDKETKACARIDLAVEAQFLQTLSHPNIVSLHGLGEEPGNEDFFIIIERIDRTLGQEMHTWRSKMSCLKNTVPKKEAKSELKMFMEDRIAYARQLTCALKYLHSKK